MLTYEESVQYIRSQPELANDVKLGYLDRDNLMAAERFAASEEFSDLQRTLRLRKTQPKKILDVGCGNGIASYAFAMLGHDVFAVDPDTSEDVGLGAAARLARIVKQGKISTHKAFAESLPFSDSSFDIVYTRQAVHHYSDLRQGLVECARVLKPGGILFATREHVISDEKQLEVFLRDHLLHKLHGGENAYTLATYCLALQHAGLTMKRCYGTYDTVINHFPWSNAEIQASARLATEGKFGKLLTPFVTSILPLETMWRRRRSHLHQYPGRMYSFLCERPRTPNS